MDGIINIYKEKNYTSHDVVAVIRKMLNCKKVGHTGTLDPQAEGVLPICIGKATKIAQYITSETKRYEAELTLGIATTTQDHTGDIIKQTNVDLNIVDRSIIQSSINSFKGEYLQIPPMYSAIKVDGKRLYELARQGKTIERKSRKVIIYSIDIVKYIPPNRIIIDVICSKGTYIRTLCSDIGEVLGYGGHMSALIRTQSGSFNIQDSIKLDELKEYIDNDNIDNVVIKIEEALHNFPKVVTNKNVFKALHNGNIIYEYGIDKLCFLPKVNDEVLVYDYNKYFVGIYKVFYDDQNKLFMKPVKIL